MERIGVRYLDRWARQGPNRTDDEIHIFDDDERKAIDRVVRWAVIRSAAAGALSALVAAAGIWFGDLYFAPDPISPTTGQRVLYWSFVLAIAGGAAVIEIGYLYFDALRSVLWMAQAAGLPLVDEQKRSVDMKMAGGLARAALELPNRAEPKHGVDPLREASKWRIIGYSLAYKGKIAVTNFMLKALVRRAMGRAGVRGAIELIAVPVTAIWNAVVTWLIMREARLRIVGPFAGAELVEELWQKASPTSPQREGAVRAVAAAIVRSADLHPNLVSLLDQVMLRADGEPDAVGDTDRFMTEFREASEEERRWLMGIATLAAISDGRLTTAERALLLEMRQICGLPSSLREVESLTKRLRNGRRISAHELLHDPRKK